MANDEIVDCGPFMNGFGKLEFGLQGIWWKGRICGKRKALVVLRLGPSKKT